MLNGKPHKDMEITFHETRLVPAGLCGCEVEVIFYSEMSAHIRTTRCYIPGYGKFHYVKGVHR
jgi:hypothetical protein